MPPPPRTWTTNLFARWGAFVYDRRWAVIIAWIAMAMLLKFVAPDWSAVAHDGDLEQLPANTTLIEGQRLSRQAFPADKSRSQVVLILAREDSELSIADREFALRLGNELAASAELTVVDVWNEKTPVVGESLRSRTGHAQRVVVRLKNEFMATENIRVLAEVERIVAAGAS